MRRRHPRRSVACAVDGTPRPDAAPLSTWPGALTAGADVAGPAERALERVVRRVQIDHDQALTIAPLPEEDGQ